MPPKPREWTEEELAYIREHFVDTPNRLLAKRFGVGQTLMRKKAREMGLKKDINSPNFRKMVGGYISERKKISPNKGVQFQKGNTIGHRFKSGERRPKEWFIERAKKAHIVRNRLIYEDRLRIKYGLKPKTKLVRKLVWNIDKSKYIKDEC